MYSSFAQLAQRSDIPVDPSALEGQELAKEELARSIYSTQPTWFDRLVQQIADFLNSLQVGGGSGGPVLAIILFIALLAIVFVTVRFSRRATRARARAEAQRSHKLFDDSRNATQLREDAAAHKRAGRLTEAFLDLYRAIIRSLDERVLLDDRPGLTAQEAALLAKLPFPSHSATWDWAAGGFDAGCYGETSLSLEELLRLEAFDSQIATSTPVHRSAVRELVP